METRRWHNYTKNSQSVERTLSERRCSMAELVVKLPQAEYQTFLKKVAKLRKAGVDVQYEVSQAKKRVVKLTMLTPVEPDKWDAICDGVQ